MMRRIFLQWAGAAAVAAVVQLKQFSPMEIPFAGGVELEPQPTEVYEERVSTVLMALDQWNQKRVAVQGACGIDYESPYHSNLPGLAATGLQVCGRGTIGCSVVHPAYHDDFYSTEQWDETRQRWVLDLKLRDGEKREVVDSAEDLAKRLDRRSAWKTPASRRGFFGRAFAQGDQFDGEGGL